MKKLFVALLLSVTLSAQAQITVTRIHMPQPNDSFIYQNIATQGLNISATGAGYTWDFRNVTPTPQGQVIDKYQLANATPYGFLFQGAYGIKIADSIGVAPLQFKNLYRYVQVTNTAYSAIGIGFTLSLAPFPLGGRFSDPDEIFRLPMNYNMEWNGTYRLAIPLPTIGSYIQNGSREAKVDGWGTILLPGGRSYEVLRVKANLVQIDSFDFQGNAFAVPSQRVEYAWVSRDFRAPVFEATAQQAGQNQVPGTARYLVSGAAANNGPGVGIRFVNASGKWTIYPNPSAGALNFMNLEAGSYALKMYDVLGKLVFQKDLISAGSTFNITLPPGIENGIYLMTLENGEVSKQWKQIIKH